MASVKPVKLVTGLFRFSYLNHDEAKLNDEGKERYGAMLIFPKSDKKLLKQFEDAMQQAFVDGKEIHGLKTPKPPANGFKVPLHDGDEERPDDPACADSYYFNANSNDKIQVLGRDPNKGQLPLNEIYSGMWGYASLGFKAFNQKSKGISVFLNGIQKIKDDTRLDGRTTDVSKDFQEWDDETQAESEDDWMN